MFKRLKINKFNKKWAGKELMFCPKIYEDILFWPNSVHKCCHCTKVPYSPPFISYIPYKFDFFDYLYHVDRIMQSNQMSVGICTGCKFLVKQIQYIGQVIKLNMTVHLEEFL